MGGPVARGEAKRVPLLRHPHSVWLIAGAILYAILTLWLALHHEAWCDEADTWLLMRDGGVGVMLANTGRAETPALWYLLIAPLASAGLPYVAQQLLTLVCCWTAMALFLMFAPFRVPLKLLFLFSFYATAEYAVQARPYALLIAVLFGIAAAWPARDEKPLRLAVLTALLANTTIHGLLIAAILGLLFLVDSIVRRRRAVAATTIMLAGGIASAIQVWPAADAQRLSRYIDPGTVPYAIGYAFLPRLDPRISFAAGLLILVAAVLAIGDRPGPLLFMTLSIASLLVLFVYVWVGGTRHTGLILMVVIASVWMAGSTRPRMKTAFEYALMLALAWSVYVAAREAIDETRWAYSGSREMAEFVAAHVPADATIAAHPPVQVESVLVYLPGRRFWYPGYGGLGSYMTWGRSFDRANSMPVDGAISRARQRLRQSRWFLLVNHELPDPAGFTLLYTNRRTIYAKPMERYWLYAAGTLHLSAE